MNGNPSNTEYAILETGTTQYVNATTGALQAGEDWQAYSGFGGSSGVTVTGLLSGTNYTFQVKARNGDNQETVFGGTESAVPMGTPYKVACTVEPTSICADNTTTALITAMIQDDANITLTSTTNQINFFASGTFFPSGSVNAVNGVATVTYSATSVNPTAKVQAQSSGLVTAWLDLPVTQCLPPDSIDLDAESASMKANGKSSILITAILRPDLYRGYREQVRLKKAEGGFYDS